MRNLTKWTVRHNGDLRIHIMDHTGKQGSYRQVCVKFKDFSRTSKILSYCFQGLKTYENTSPVENQNDLELDFKVFFFTDSCCSDIVHDESN